MREIGTLCWKLLLIALVAGLALGTVNAVTAAPIEKQARQAAQAARQAVLPDAAMFTENEDGTVFTGLDKNGAVVGYVTSGTVKGYASMIEVTVGVDTNGVITGVSVGGKDFAETAGLGAKTKEPAFTTQFAGKASPLAVNKDGGEIEAVSSATVSSRAVTGEVSRLVAVLTEYGKGA